jgi:hypothetical protein
MTDTVEGAPEKELIEPVAVVILDEGSQTPMDAVKAATSRGPRPQRPHGDPNRFLRKAVQVVVDNYNANRDPKTTHQLTANGVYIVWYAKTLRNWKAIVASPVVFGILWEVSFDGTKQEIYIDVYKKVTNVVIPAGRSKS